MKKEFEDSPFEYIEWLEQENRKLTKFVKKVYSYMFDKDIPDSSSLRKRNAEAFRKYIKATFDELNQ